MKNFIEDEGDIDALLLGLAFMGTGGGGTIDMGKSLLMDAYESGKEFNLVPLHELPDEIETVCAYMMGSSSPMTNEKKNKMIEYGLIDVKVNNMQEAAVRLLEKIMNINIGAVMPLELGAAATSGAISSAACLGLPVIDADYMGRALPEIAQTLPVIFDESMLPLASVDRYQNEVLINKASSYKMAERLGKSAAAASFDLAGQAAFLLKVGTVKKMSLTGTLSSSMQLGKKIQAAQKQNEDVVDTVLTHFNGRAKLLFKGYISQLSSYEQEGYFFGENHLIGCDEFKQDQYRIWFKNENIVAWYNEKPDVACPDLIVMLDSKTGIPLLNGRVEEKQSVTVLGIAADDIFQCDKALSILNPAYFGIEKFDYLPMDRVLQQRKSSSC